jgi:hypothetical protein
VTVALYRFKGEAMKLTDLASIATIIAAVAVVVTVLIYHRQLRAMTTATQMESLLVIMKYVEDLDLRRARYFMFEHGEALRHLFDTPFSWETRRAIDRRVRELSSNELGLHNIDLVLNSLNNVCFLIRGGYAPPEAVDAFMKNSLLHVWYAFEPYVYHRRRRPDTIGEPSQYAAHLEWVVVNKCRKRAVPAATPVLP